jgi:hypothetical protein
MASRRVARCIRSRSAAEVENGLSCVGEIGHAVPERGAQLRVIGAFVHFRVVASGDGEWHTEYCTDDTPAMRYHRSIRFLHGGLSAATFDHAIRFPSYAYRS